MVEKLPLVNPFGNPFGDPFGVLAHTVKAEDLVRFQKGYGQWFVIIFVMGIRVEPSDLFISDTYQIETIEMKGHYPGTCNRLRSSMLHHNIMTQFTLVMW